MMIAMLLLSGDGLKKKSFSSSCSKVLSPSDLYYSRGKAANSDHYWFTENGVPSFFIYTMGKRKAYHEVDDVPTTLLLPEINDLEALITRFIEQWMHPS